MIETRFNEIGGNFWLKPSQWDSKSEKSPDLEFVKFQKDVFYTSSGRNAINLALNQKCIENKRALLPMFTCESVIKPFIDNGFKIVFYKIEDDFSVNFDKLKKIILEHKPSVLFLQTYFGFDTLSEIRDLVPDLKKQFGFVVIEDITHSWFSDFDKVGADLYVASLRKWLELPDGGVVISVNEDIDTNIVDFFEDSEIVNLFVKASILKHNYSKSLEPSLKENFRRYFYRIEDILDNQKYVKVLSNISKSILNTSNFNTIIKTRRSNYLSLYDSVKDNHRYVPCFENIPEGVTPLYFCVKIIGSRIELQKQLAKEQIYATVLWPMPTCINEDSLNDSKELYENLLCIPCDQRYNNDDMNRIISLL